MSKYCPNLTLNLTRALFGIPLDLQSWLKLNDNQQSWNFNQEQHQGMYSHGHFQIYGKPFLFLQKLKKHWQTQGFPYDEGGSSYTCPLCWWWLSCQCLSKHFVAFSLFLGLFGQFVFHFVFFFKAGKWKNSNLPLLWVIFTIFESNHQNLIWFVKLLYKSVIIATVLAPKDTDYATTCQLLPLLVISKNITIN